MLRVASTMGESLIWQPAIYLANKFSLSLSTLPLTAGQTGVFGKMRVCKVQVQD